MDKNYRFGEPLFNKESDDLGDYIMMNGRKLYIRLNTRESADYYMDWLDKVFFGICVGCSFVGIAMIINQYWG